MVSPIPVSITTDEKRFLMESAVLMRDTGRLERTAGQRGQVEPVHRERPDREEPQDDPEHGRRRAEEQRLGEHHSGEPPAGDPEAPLKALIFDSHYDAFRGTIVHFRVVDGRLKAGDRIRFMSNEAVYKVEEVGRFQIVRKPQRRSRPGKG